MKEGDKWANSILLGRNGFTYGMLLKIDNYGAVYYNLNARVINT